MINKTHIVAQKPRGRQLNAKFAVAEVPFFVFFLSLFDQSAKYLENGLSTDRGCSTKTIHT